MKTIQINIWLLILSSCASIKNDSIVSHFSFENTPNSKKNTQKIQAIIKGNPTYTENRKGEPKAAILLDGIDDYVQLKPSELFSLNKYTISAWVRFDDVLSEGNVIFSTFYYEKPGKYWGYILNFLYIYDEKHLQIVNLRNGLWSQEQSFTLKVPQINSGIFYHIAATFDGDTAKLYLNGRKLGEKKIIYPAFHPLYKFSSIGGQTWINKYAKRDMFKGAIDDVIIYARALSDAEIYEFYKNTH